MAASLLLLAAFASADTVIVLNKAAGSAIFLDRESGEVLATLPTGDGPHEVAVSPDGSTAVAAVYGARQPGKTLRVFDLVARKAVKTVDLGQHRRPHGLAFLPGGTRLVVTAEASRALLVVHLESGRVEAAIDTGQRVSHMVALSPKAKRAYVANIGSGSVTVIDLERRKRIKIIPTGPGAEGIDTRPDGREVWVTNRAANTVSILDTGKLEVAAEIACARFPIRVKFTPDGRLALVSCAFSGEVAVIDVKTRKELRRIGLAKEGETGKGNMFRRGGPLPVGIVIPADGREAFVATGNYDELAVIDLESFKVRARFKTAREPDGLAYSRK